MTTPFELTRGSYAKLTRACLRRVSDALSKEAVRHVGFFVELIEASERGELERAIEDCQARKGGGRNVGDDTLPLFEPVTDGR